MVGPRGPNDITGMVESRVIKYYTQLEYIIS